MNKEYKDGVFYVGSSRSVKKEEVGIYRIWHDDYGDDYGCSLIKEKQSTDSFYANYLYLKIADIMKHPYKEKGTQ